jgi:hypothetical protein
MKKSKSINWSIEMFGPQPNSFTIQ